MIGYGKLGHQQISADENDVAVGRSARGWGLAFCDRIFASDRKLLIETTS